MPPASDANSSDPAKTTPVSASRMPRAALSTSVPSVETLRPLFPELEILGQLGAGGMGAVYQARQPRLDRFVALKIMVSAPGQEADFALRFLREAQTLARLSHQHIVVLHEFGELGPERTGAEPLFYFLMEYVEGTDLGKLIKSGELTQAQTLAIVPQICEALQYAHDLGITHRDIKPANLLLDKKGTVKIADFGLARMIGAAEGTLMAGLTQTGTTMGTPHYMAPEVWEHPDQVDRRSDLYSLGVVLYEMLTGERPAGVFEPPSRRAAGLDRRLDAVVMRALDKNPDRRFQQAHELKTEIDRISGAQRGRKARTGSRVVPPKPARKTGLFAAMIVLLLALAGFLAAKKVPSGGDGTGRPDTAMTAPLPQWQRFEFAKMPASEATQNTTGLEMQGEFLHAYSWSAWKYKAEASLGNTALRAVIDWKTPASKVTLTFRESPTEAGRLCYARLDKDAVTVGCLERGKDRSVLKLPHPLRANPAPEVTLEAALVGGRMAVWLNGQLLGVADGLPAAARGASSIKASDALFRTVEVIELDSFSELAALRLLGIDTAVPTPAADPPSRISGRLRGSGFQLDGSPLDFSRAEGVTDFVQVILTCQDWIALRAGGRVLDATEGWLKADKASRLLTMEFVTSTYGILNTLDHLSIRRGASAGVKAVPEEAQQVGVVDAVWGDGYALALLKDGTARVWGECYTSSYKDKPMWQAPPPEALVNVIKVAATQQRCATLTLDGGLHFWGSPENSIGLESLKELGLEITDLQTSWDPLRLMAKTGQVVAVGGKDALHTGLLEENVDAISACFLRRKGSPFWEWRDKRYAGTEPEVNALLRQIGDKQPDAFDIRVTGDSKSPRVAAVWIEPAE